MAGSKERLNLSIKMDVSSSRRIRLMIAKERSNMILSFPQKMKDLRQVPSELHSLALIISPNSHFYQPQMCPSKILLFPQSRNKF